jgi:hypothetical protein
MIRATPARIANTVSTAPRTAERAESVNEIVCSIAIEDILRGNRKAPTGIGAFSFFEIELPHNL